jgi:predicted regulator of amino acid metabolism with ACT domain
MRSRGWAGVTPSSDEEAISRILSAVDEEVAEHGAAIRLADVARRLGVTRQTVTAVVEDISFGVENLSGDPQLENLLTR